MKNTLLILFFLTTFSQIIFGQDTLVLKSSSRVIGELRKIDSSQVSIAIRRGNTRIETNAKTSEIQSIRPYLKASSEFGSDTIYKFNMDRIIGKVVRIENDSVYITDIVTGNTPTMVVPVSDIQTVGMRSDKKNKEPNSTGFGGAQIKNTGSFGFGVGMDHGGFGLNLAVYPEKHIGLFAGIG